MLKRAALLVLCLTGLSWAALPRSEVNVKESWPGAFKGNITLELDKDLNCGWSVVLVFKKPVRSLQIWNVDVVANKRNRRYTVKSKDYNSKKTAGETIELEFIGYVKGKAPKGSAFLDPESYDYCNPATKTPPSGGSTDIMIKNSWQRGFEGMINIVVPKALKCGWKLLLEFSKPVTNLRIWSAVVESAEGGVKYILKNKDWNTKKNPGQYIRMNFLGRKRGKTPKGKVSILPESYNCETTVPTSPPTPTPTPSSTPPPTPPPTPSATPSKSPSPTPTRTGKPSKTPSPTPTPTPSETPSPTPTPTPSETPSPTPTPTPATKSSPSTSPTTKVTTKSPRTTLCTTRRKTTQATKATTQKPASTAAPAKYNYDEVLRKSILFYEAQRSGKLPPTNRVSWRKSSALGDKGDNKEDLTGGWYDAGDFVKFNFPMAASVTVLAWGLIENKDAYQKAGELNNMFDSIKWPLDYFIKCHTAKNELYGQVGNGKSDHAYWGRPEDMTMARPAYKLTPSRPGSDLAAETAAAMAAGSIAFRNTDPAYAAKLLKHAEEIYAFAVQYRGKYSDSITDARDFYKSWSGYYDELAWGAAWLYKATNDDTYRDATASLWTSNTPKFFSWDDKTAGTSILMYQLTKENKYKRAAETFLNQWLPGGSISYTPKGLAWGDKWGPNRYAANAAFLALVAADAGMNAAAYRQFATKQIGYMLGDAGRSFVVGFGQNPPQRPHHRSSSCPTAPLPCNWENYNYNGPNPQVLTGALVGGPNQNDVYNDDRNDYISNEVACDYNAGFQSAVAGLRKLTI